MCSFITGRDYLLADTLRLPFVSVGILRHPPVSGILPKYLIFENLRPWLVFAAINANLFVSVEIVRNLISS